MRPSPLRSVALSSVWTIVAVRTTLSKRPDWEDEASSACKFLPNQSLKPLNLGSDEVRFSMEGESIGLGYVGDVRLLGAGDLVVDLPPAVEEVDPVVHEPVAILEGSRNLVPRTHRRLTAVDRKLEVVDIECGVLDFPGDFQKVQGKSPDYRILERQIGQGLLTPLFQSLVEFICSLDSGSCPEESS